MDESEYRRQTDHVSAAMTTIRVSRSVSARLDARARRLGLSVDAYLIELLDTDEWADRMTEAAGAMRSLSSGERAEYLAEAAAWDATYPD